MDAANKLGGGLVEISAVATLIGAPIAEALVHGYKAAAGLAWAPMSFFGIIHVAKACISSSVPDWLRESLGLRNAFVDEAIGVMLPINPNKEAKGRVDLGDACAVQVDDSHHGRPLLGDGGADDDGTDNLPEYAVTIEPEKTVREADEKGRGGGVVRAGLFPFTQDAPRKPRGKCIYTLDRSAQLGLDTVAPAKATAMINIFMPDDDGVPSAWKEWFILLCSLLKLLEVACLYRMGSTSLWYWTMIGWGYTFLAAVIIQARGLSRDNARRATRDILAGSLPSPLHTGGDDGKLVLGMPANVRRHFIWRSLRGLGVFFYAAEIFGIFLQLTNETSRVTYVWIGFQVLWLASRTIIHYYVEGAAAARQGIIVSQPWELSSRGEQWRALTVLDQASAHQITMHPRGFNAYQLDCLTFHELAFQLARCNWTFTYILRVDRFPHDGRGRVRTLSIAAVTGDTLVRSGVWYTRASIDNAALYDASIIFLLDADNQPVAMPTVRVYACDCGNHARGNSHKRTCTNIKWLYFIPTRWRRPVGGRSSVEEEVDGWLYVHSRSAIGMLPAEMLTDDELDRRFKVGMWKISIKSTEALRADLDVIREAARVIMGLVRGPATRNYSSSGSPALRTSGIDDGGV